jgi:(R,R)-butanediol dehydrogenase / meso-butanediol dehydrogenase / diacetyl reductase
MRAAVITGQHRVDVIELPAPTPGPGQVVIDITLCGICGTDLHAYQSGAPYNPAICGHEWVGVVSAAGADTRRISEGDRVVVAVPPPCGQCGACRAGQSIYCSTVFLSATGRDVRDPKHGGFANQLTVAANRVLPALAQLADVEAAQVEPATVTLHAVRKSGLRLGDLAVIQGAGPIGLTTLQWVNAAGAGATIVIEPNESRRELARSLGATMTVAPGEAAQTLVREQSAGLGADHVFECVGRAPAIQSAVDLARRGGTMTLIGLSDTDASIVPAVWLVKEINLNASLAYTHEEFAMSMGMIADGRMRLTEMHSSTVGLDGLGGALADLASGTSIQTKVLVDPRANLAASSPSA